MVDLSAEKEESGWSDRMFGEEDERVGRNY